MLVTMVLVGCVAAPPVFHRIEMPVPSPCVKVRQMPAKPVYRLDKLSASAADGEKVIALTHEWLWAESVRGRLWPLSQAVDDSTLRRRWDDNVGRMITNGSCDRSLFFAFDECV